MLAPSLVSRKISNKAEPYHPLIPNGMGLQFFLITRLFFLGGVPNNLNDVLIRQFMTSFALSRFQAGLVQSAFNMGYFLLATPAALLMRRFGYKSGFFTGLLLFGAGAFLFWPATIVGRYGVGFRGIAKHRRCLRSSAGWLYRRCLICIFQFRHSPGNDDGLEYA